MVRCSKFCKCQVKVAFHCSLSLLDHVDQTDEEVPLGVELIHSASGQRKLKFQQNLLIHYSNNTLQVRDCSESQIGLKPGECFKSNIFILFLLCSCRQFLSVPIWIFLHCVCPVTA